MGERDVDGRAGAATDGPAPSSRPHSSTDAGPFGGAPTKLADAASIRNLIEKSAQSEDDDRKTREMDPKQFAALVRRDGRTPPKPMPVVAPPAPAPPAPPAPPPVSIDDELDAAFADPDVAGVTASAHQELAVRVDTSALQAELAAAATKAPPAAAPTPVATTAPPAAAPTPVATTAPPAAVPAPVAAEAPPAAAPSTVPDAEPEPSVLGSTTAAAAEPAVAPRTPTPSALPVLPARGPSARTLVIASLVLIAIAVAIYAFALR